MVCSVKSDAEVVQQRDDLAMVHRPHLWPQHGKLPLRRHGWTMDKPASWLGILLDEEHGAGWRVFVGICGWFGAGDILTYDSAEALLAEWEVD